MSCGLRHQHRVRHVRAGAIDERRLHISRAIELRNGVEGVGVEPAFDDLLGLSRPKTPAMPQQDPETKRLWKKFQQVRELPSKDQHTVIRLVTSLVATKKASWVRWLLGLQLEA